MKQAMKPVSGLFVVLLVVVAANLLWKSGRAAEVIPWRANYAAALDEGRSSNRPVFVAADTQANIHRRGV